MPKRLNASLTGSVLTAERSIPSTPRSEMMQLLDGAAFSAVFESSGEALLVVDTLGTLRRANRRRNQICSHGVNDRPPLLNRKLIRPSTVSMERLPMVSPHVSRCAA
jgi:hypothetical protein